MNEEYAWDDMPRLGGYRCMRSRFISMGARGSPAYIRVGEAPTGWEVMPVTGGWLVLYQLNAVTTVSTEEEAKDYVMACTTLGFDPATLGN